MGDRIADQLTRFSGSWSFLFVHAIWWTIWIAFPIVEGFPFGLLTMILSLEAIVLGTLILMSQNRAAERDRQMLALDRHRAEHVEKIAEHLNRVHAHQLKILEHVETLVGQVKP